MEGPTLAMEAQGFIGQGQLKINPHANMSGKIA